MRRSLSFLTALASCAAVLTTACGGGSDRFVVTAAEAPFVPVVESTDLAVGVDRIVLRLVDRDVSPEFEPGTTFVVRYFEPVEGGVRFRSDESLTEVGLGNERFYAGTAPFDAAGTWEIQVRVSPPGKVDDELLVSPRLPIFVATRAGSPSVGSPVPGTASLATALERGRPAIVVLALVEDCFGSGLCERARAQAQGVAAEAGLSLVVEQGLETEAGEGPIPDESGVLTDWSLENDPWIYVVGSDGVIADRFERLALDEELEMAVAALKRCFVGESEEASLAGQIVAHGIGPGDRIPAEVEAIMRSRLFDPAEFVRSTADGFELGLFAEGPSTIRAGFHDLAFVFVLVQPEPGADAAWQVAESSLLVEVACEG